MEEGWWEGLLNGKTGMFPSNFTKEILPESDSASLDTPGSHEELRSGRTSAWGPGEGGEGRRATGASLICWCPQVRRVQGAKAMAGTVGQTQGRERSSLRR